MVLIILEILTALSLTVVENCYFIWSFEVLKIHPIVTVLVFRASLLFHQSDHVFVSRLSFCILLEIYYFSAIGPLLCIPKDGNYLIPKMTYLLENIS